MNKVKAWVLILLVFCAGFAGGVVVTRGVVRHFVCRAILQPNFVREAVERRIDVKLRLDKEQRAKVHDVLVDTQGELTSLRQEFQPRFLAIMNRAQTNIAAVLTPEQREKFDEFKQENRHFWQPR